MHRMDEISLHLIFGGYPQQCVEAEEKSSDQEEQVEVDFRDGSNHVLEMKEHVVRPSE